ncbi:MAG: hypothetical protein ACYTDX_03050 [Planctomycetota bacterium]
MTTRRRRSRIQVQVEAPVMTEEEPRRFQVSTLEDRIAPSVIGGGYVEGAEELEADSSGGDGSGSGGGDGSGGGGGGGDGSGGGRHGDGGGGGGQRWDDGITDDGSTVKDPEKVEGDSGTKDPSKLS